MSSPTEPTSTLHAASNNGASSLPAAAPAAGSSSSSYPGSSSPDDVASGTSSYPGRRFGSIIRLRPECVAAYKECHAKCWPEVQKQITESHIHDYVIYHDPDTGLLFSSFKYTGADLERDMAVMRENPRVREWWSMTDSYQESLVPGAQSSEAGAPSWWKALDEVFYQA